MKFQFPCSLFARCSGSTNVVRVVAPVAAWSLAFFGAESAASRLRDSRADSRACAVVMRRPLPLPPLPLPPDVSNHACGQLKVPREKRRLCDKSTRRVDVRGVRLPSGDAIMAVAVLMRLLLAANLSFYARALPLRVYEDTHPFHAAS
jgi:hypothetical protein